jgi:hypothetical protein
VQSFRASAEDARQLLQSPTVDSMRTRYVSLSTFFFRFFQTTSGDPHQFLIGQVLNVVVSFEVFTLLCYRKRRYLACLHVVRKIDSQCGDVSGHRFVGQLLGYAIAFRDPDRPSVVVDGDEGISFSNQFSIEVWSFLGAACRVPRDALLELSVLGRLSITDFIESDIFFFLLTVYCSPRVISAVECFTSFYMDCIELCLPLPSTNDGVDVERIKL